VLRNRGDATFVPSFERADTQGAAIAAGDLDGDGKADLVIDATQPPGLFYLAGRGDGSFAEPTPLYKWPWLSDLVLGDTVGNGQLGAIVLDLYQNTVTIANHRSSGGFDGLGFTVALHPTSVAIGDLNGDGLLDLATTSSCLRGLSLLLSGKRPWDYSNRFVSAFSDPANLVLADLNHDRLIDALFVAADRGALRIALNQGGGDLRGLTDISSGDPRTRPVAVDLDADGRIDLLVAHSGRDTLDVLRNTTP
jgi:hypothetical protein